MRKRRVLAALMAAATGDLPDIIQVGGMQDSNTMQFMKEGHFLELTDMECLNNVVDEYKDAIKFQGKNYVVPISANFSGVFYNKDMFEEAGSFRLEGGRRMVHGTGRTDRRQRGGSSLLFF